MSTARLAAALSDRYRIERELGQGGMATVYLARDVKHDREVALKVLRPELAAIIGAERFLSEIRITARLDHPHILTLIDSGEADGMLFYVLPFVRGESLRTRLLREKQLGVDEALAITKQIAGALEYAHQRGVVHRDIKPENILIHEGEAVLTDFGIALAVKEAGGNRLTETGLSLGTPQYMSPEQATGDRELDARSDVYSLAAVLYEMLAGEPPHTGATVQAVIAKLMTERPTRLRTVRETVPEGVDNAVAKALAKVPADRYAGAAAFTAALTAGSQAPQPAGRRAAPIKWIVGAGATVVLSGLFLLRDRGSAATPSPFRCSSRPRGRPSSRSCRRTARWSRTWSGGARRSRSAEGHWWSARCPGRESAPSTLSPASPPPRWPGVRTRDTCSCRRGIWRAIVGSGSTCFLSAAERRAGCSPRPT
jgi:eukaryotic-like serine/threonine-protein kinase